MKVGLPGGPVVKNLPASAEDMGSIPGPTLRSGKEVASLIDTELVLFVLVLVQSHLVPRLYP